jgi:hypothetical protein
MVCVSQTTSLFLLLHSLNNDLESKASISIRVSPAVPSAPMKIGGIRTIGFRSGSVVPVGGVSIHSAYSIVFISTMLLS